MNSGRKHNLSSLEERYRFLQIGKNCSGHVLTLLVVTQKADDRFLSYYTHLMFTKCAFRKQKFDRYGCLNFEVMSSPVFVSFFWGHPVYQNLFKYIHSRMVYEN